MDSPLISSACSKVDCWKFRVGKTPNLLKTETLAIVPKVRYFSVAGPKLFFVRFCPMFSNEF